MKNAILLHGRPGKDEYYNSEHPSASNSHWLPWLQNQLIVRGINADTPEVPFAYDPKWELWQKEVERFDITDETILVGHSTGAAFWLKYISKNPELTVGKVILVAPAMEYLKTDFFKWELNNDLVAQTKGVTVFYSDNDDPRITKTVERLKKEVPGITFKEFPGYGHFTFDEDATNTFPELLTEILT